MSHRKRRRTAVNSANHKNAVNFPVDSQRGVVVNDQVAAPGSTPTDLARMLDKEWFRCHPYRSHRLRRAIPGEIPGGSAATYIVVRQIAPGLRSRGYFEVSVSLPSDEAPEHIAHAMYDLIMKFPRKLIPLHEWKQRSRAYEVAADPEDPSHNTPLYRH